MNGDLGKKTLSQQMNRRQFLQYFGAALLAVFGIGNLLSLLTGSKHHTNPLTPGETNGRHGFGSSKFGV